MTTLTPFGWVRPPQTGPADVATAAVEVASESTAVAIASIASHRLPLLAGTHVYLSVVRDSVLRETIEAFDLALGATGWVPDWIESSTLALAGREHGWARSPGWSALSDTTVAPRLPHHDRQDAVAAVAWVKVITGLPETYVIDAAGIAERSYHEWKGNNRQPRLRSQGRLWAVVQAVEDLAADLGGEHALQMWLYGDVDGSRVALFRQGRLDLLRAAAAPTGPAQTGQSPAAVFALGGEPELPVAPLPPGVEPRRPSRGKPTRRTNRATAGTADR